MDQSRGQTEETARYLYKLIFQLLLLLETNNKMVVAVYHAALENRVTTLSTEIGNDLFIFIYLLPTCTYIVTASI